MLLQLTTFIFRMLELGAERRTYATRTELLVKRKKTAQQMQAMQSMQRQAFEAKEAAKGKGERGKTGQEREELWSGERLEERMLDFISQPSGNKVKINFLRPKPTSNSALLPCVYYIHGGGMAAQSAFDVIYRMWGRVIANRGVCVAMVDFRLTLPPKPFSNFF